MNEETVGKKVPPVWNFRLKQWDRHKIAPDNVGDYIPQDDPTQECYNRLVAEGLPAPFAGILALRAIERENQEIPEGRIIFNHATDEWDILKDGEIPESFAPYISQDEEIQRFYKTLTDQGMPHVMAAAIVMKIVNELQNKVGEVVDGHVSVNVVMVGLNGATDEVEPEA